MTDDNTPADAGNNTRGDEQLRNYADLKEAISTREEYKQQLATITAREVEKDQLIADLTQSNQKKSGEFEKLYSSEHSSHSALQEQYGVLQAENVELTNMVENFKTEAIMKQFMDTALKTVKHRERAETMLLGLAALGRVNMTPEEGIEDAALEATKLLQQVDPSLFGSDGTKANGVTGNIPGARINSNGAAQMIGQFKMLPTKR